MKHFLLLRSDLCCDLRSRWDNTRRRNGSDWGFVLCWRVVRFVFVFVFVFVFELKRSSAQSSQLYLYVSMYRCICIYVFMYCLYLYFVRVYLYRIGTEQCTINFPGGPSSPLRLIGHRWAMYAHTRPPTQSNSPMIIIWSDINQILVKFESKILFIIIRTNHKLIL